MKKTIYEISFEVEARGDSEMAHWQGVSAHSPSLLGHPLILVVQQVQAHPGMAKKTNYLTNLKNYTKISYMVPCMLHSP